VSCVCTTQLVLLAVTVLQYEICCWLCQKSENYGYEGLENLGWIVLNKFLFQSPLQEHYSYQVCNSMYKCDPSVVKLYDRDFWVPSQKFWKKDCFLPCLSVCVSAWNNTAPTGWIFIKFENCVCVFFSQLLRKFKFN